MSTEKQQVVVCLGYLLEKGAVVKLPKDSGKNLQKNFPCSSNQLWFYVIINPTLVFCRHFYLTV